jgi:hypothetical protein
VFFRVSNPVVIGAPKRNVGFDGTFIIVLVIAHMLNGREQFSNMHCITDENM